RAVTVTPASATNLVGTQHTVTVTVHDGSPAENPIAGAKVVCEVAGVNEGADVTYSDTSQQTGANGQIECTYTGNNKGTDTITATADGASGTATKTWVEYEVSVSDTPT